MTGIVKYISALFLFGILLYSTCSLNKLMAYEQREEKKTLSLAEGAEEGKKEHRNTGYSFGEEFVEIHCLMPALPYADLTTAFGRYHHRFFAAPPPNILKPPPEQG